MMQHDTPCIDLVRIEGRMENVEKWEERQNGTLEKLDAKVDNKLTEVAKAQMDQAKAQRNQFYGLVVVAALLAANLAATLGKTP